MAALAVEAKVTAGTKTSSPALHPKAMAIEKRADVHEFIAIVCLAPTKLAIERSNSRVYSPRVS